jgi:tRNA(Ile)-lysidine synthase
MKLDPLELKIKLILEAHLPNETLKKGLLIACSGGSDSISLLHIIHGISIRQGIPIQVVTVNHNLRTESSNEIHSIELISSNLGIKCHTAVFQKPKSHSENSLRDKRRTLFIDILNETGLGAVALGHTMEDQAETVLMRIIRGTGINGLKAMDIYSNPYIRPLLSTQKHQLQEYLSQRNIEWFEDKSNREDRYFRNRVRNRIIPLLKQENPSIISGLWGLSQTASEEYSTILNEINKLSKLTEIFRMGHIIPLKNLLNVPRGTSKGFFMKEWNEYKSKGELERKHIEIIFASLENKGKSLTLPGNVSTEIIGDNFYMGPPLTTPRFNIVLSKPGSTVELPRGEIILKQDDFGEIIIPDSSWPVTIRNKKNGDRLSRKKMGLVRLKKVYQNIPKRIKEDLIVLVDNKDEIIWAERAGKAWGISDGIKYNLKWSKINYHLSQ